jgi:Flp pilus assembly pilin Flp
MPLKGSTTMLKIFAILTNPVRRDDRGISAVEYALLLIAIAAAILVSLKAFGTALGGVFSTAAGDLTFP